MTNIAVMYGGRSGEHEVSLQSASSVVRNLDLAIYTVTLIGIAKDGRWFLQNPDLVQQVRNSTDSLSISCDEQNLLCIVPGMGLRHANELLEIDAVFPVLHGTFGEDGTIQGSLDIAGIPYVGSGVLGSAIGMDKDVAKRVWQASGLPVVPSITVLRGVLVDESGVLADSAVRILVSRAEHEFGYPVFVKPARAGSSVGVSLAHDRPEFLLALEAAFRFDTKLLIEPAIKGQEIECSVVGNTPATAFPPGEVIPTHQFYDYDAKYHDPNGAALEIPARLSQSEAEEIRRMAVAAHEKAGVEGMSRVDFFITRPDRVIYINEINTIPGFTRISMFPRMCGAAGLDYPTLLKTLIDLALERWEEQRALTFDYSSLGT